jgi:hypothetical protein
MQTLPYNATSSQMVVKIIGFIIFLYSENQWYWRRSIYDHFNELIGGINHQFADMECQI